MPVLAAGAVLAVVVFAGFSGGDDSSGPNPSKPNPGAVHGSGLTVPDSTPDPVVTKPDPGVKKTQLSRTLRKGMSGDDVKALQQRLHELKFDPGPIDGQFGGGTQQSVWAFEGIAKGLRNTSQTGQVTDEMWQVLQDDIKFQPRRPGKGTHMEIYLDLQAAIVFTDDTPTLLTHISSGTGARWCDIVTYNTDQYGQPLDPPVERDECGISKTPGGVFQFYRRYAGDRQGPLGGMFNPVYFNYGIAVHGAINVPDTPASHGCIRIPMWISQYFPSLVKNKDYVYVWDGKKEPETQSTDDKKPVFNFRNPDATTTTSSTTTTSTTLPPTTTTHKPTTTTTVKPTVTTTSKPTTTTSVAPATT
jgi:hypothetical protein